MNNKSQKLKKVECFITEKKELQIQAICEEDHQTRAEFVRRAIDEHIEKRLIIKNNRLSQ